LLSYTYLNNISHTLILSYRKKVEKSRKTLTVSTLLTYILLFTLILFPLEISAQKSRGIYVKKKAKIAKKASFQKDEALGSAIGEPWTGEEGVTRTTEDIMREEALEREKPPKPIRLVEEREVKRRDLPLNPESPLIAKYPIDPTTAPVRTESNFSPQTVGLDFPAATLADTLSFPRLILWETSVRLNSF
jgi:hypothetical protein